MVSVYPRLQEPSYKAVKPANLAQAQTPDSTLSASVDDRALPEHGRSHRSDDLLRSAYHLERRTFL